MTMTTLLQAVATVESSNLPHSIRFEPTLYGWPPAWITAGPALARIQQIHNCNHTTALMVAATSWGAYQLLGANIYGDPVAYPKNIAALIYTPVDQDATAITFIKSLGYDPAAIVSTMQPADVLGFAKAYNGPGAVDSYANAIKAAAA